MEEHGRCLQIQALLLVCGLAAGFFFGPWGMASALAAGLAILLPEAIGHVLMRRNMRLRRQSFAGAFSAWALKFFTTVIFVAVGIHVLGANLVIMVWLLTLFATAMVIPVSMMMVAAKEKR